MSRAKDKQLDVSLPESLRDRRDFSEEAQNPSF